MNGPFDLTIKNINLIKEEPGVYILGGKNSDDSYWGCYVGRSDEDISDRINHWFNLVNKVESPENDSEECIVDNKPIYYWREYVSSAKEAYDLECKITTSMTMDTRVTTFTPQKLMLFGLVMFVENKID